MMKTTERKPTGQHAADAKVVRMCPDNELGEPVHDFDSTFRAADLLLDKFFPKK